MIHQERSDVRGVGQNRVRTQNFAERVHQPPPIATPSALPTRKLTIPAPAPISTIRRAPLNASRPVKRLRTRPMQKRAMAVRAAVLTNVPVVVVRVARNGIKGTAAPTPNDRNE